MRLAVISQSARVYAHFAHQAGHTVLAVDGFADAETRALATTLLHWPPILTGWTQAQQQDLNRTLDLWQADAIVIGAGFEQDNVAYADLYARYPVAGVTPALVQQAKDPFWLAATCQRLGIVFPQTITTLPTQGRWLIKQRGGCGGMHIRAWQPGQVIHAQTYLQRWQPGMSVGALCIGNGKSCHLIGVHALHRQSHSYQYAGASRLLDAALEQAMQHLLARLYPALPMTGIFSLDALWHAGHLQLLEVNPRLSASMRLYADLPLMSMHLAACDGEALPAIAPAAYHATHRMLYATATLDAAQLDCPDWIEDRPVSGSIAAGQPVCSLYAQGKTALAVQQQVQQQQTLLRKQWGTYVSERIQYIED